MGGPEVFMGLSINLKKFMKPSFDQPKNILDHWTQNPKKKNSNQPSTHIDRTGMISRHSIKLHSLAYKFVNIIPLPTYPIMAKHQS